MFGQMPRGLGAQYSPLYFLASLGAGGLAVTFFMWLMFWVPKPDTPVPVFEAIIAAFREGGFHYQLAILGAWVGIVIFAVLHVRLLLWNIREFRAFRATGAYRELRQGNAETQLLAAPLTVAMTINVGFVLGMSFLPGMWSVVEWLFPLAMLAFLLVGLWALALLRDFWGRVLTQGNFDCAANNSLVQLLPAFALAMVGVGLAAPAAMSNVVGTVGMSLVLSSFFLVTAVISGAVQLVLGFRAMLDQAANAATAPSLWIVVPIITVLSITLLRQTHGIEAHFGPEAGGVQTLGMLTYFLAAQVAFGLLGWVVLRRFGYFERFVTGSEASPGSYTLVCPGVALSVMTHFFVNVGLVRHGVIAQFGVAYWLITAVALLLQAVTIWLVIRLNRKHFGQEAVIAAQQARS